MDEAATSLLDVAAAASIAGVAARLCALLPFCLLLGWAKYY
jgi:hypothetical protein